MMVAYVISDVMIESKQNNNDYFNRLPNCQTLFQMLTHDHITTTIILNFDHLFCFISTKAIKIVEV